MKMKVKPEGQKLEACQCEQCTARRERFFDAMKVLGGGIGVKESTIKGNMSQIPEKILEHMRKLIKKVNEEDPMRHHMMPQEFPTFCRKFKAPLRQLKLDYSNPYKVLQVRKRKVEGGRGREPVSCHCKNDSTKPRVFWRLYKIHVLS